MTLRQLIDKIHARGITQTTGAFWRDSQGRSVMGGDVPLEEVRAVCMLGAIRYAHAAGWITWVEAAATASTLKEACKPQKIEILNDYLRWTFERFVDRYEQFILERGRGGE